MDEHELARRASVLPDQFASRLDESTNEGLRSMNRAGEWDELMDLLEAMHMPTDPIARLTLVEVQQ